MAEFELASKKHRQSSSITCLTRTKDLRFRILVPDSSKRTFQMSHQLSHRDCFNSLSLDSQLKERIAYVGIRMACDAAKNWTGCHGIEITNGGSSSNTSDGMIFKAFKSFDRPWVNILVRSVTVACRSRSFSSLLALTTVSPKPLGWCFLTSDPGLI